MSIADDLSAIYADEALSLPVLYGTERARGFLDWTDAHRQDASGELVLVQERTLTIAADAFSAAPTTGSAITVDGTAYTVHDVRRVNDGRELEVVIV